MMLTDIEDVRREVDLECAARDDPDVSQALATPMCRLARAIVVLACLDLTATRHPRAASVYLRRWRYGGKGRYADNVNMREWAANQRRILSRYLSDGGGELAVAVGCYDLVSKARTRNDLAKRVSKLMGA